MKNYEKIYTNIKQSICLHTRQGQEDIEDVVWRIDLRLPSNTPTKMTHKSIFRWLRTQASRVQCWHLSCVHTISNLFATHHFESATRDILSSGCLGDPLMSLLAGLCQSTVFFILVVSSGACLKVYCRSCPLCIVSSYFACSHLKSANIIHFL